MRPAALLRAEGLPRVFWYLWFGALLNRLGSFVVPLLALYLTRERGLLLGEVGLVLGAYGAGSFGAAFGGGRLADRVGRRATLVGGLVLASCALVLLGRAREPLTIAAGTFALGLVNDAYRPALSAAVSDLVPPERRVRAFGLLYWAANLGFAVAMGLGGLLASYDSQWLFWVDAGTSLAFAGVVLLAVPETRPAARPSETGSVITPLRDPDFRAFLGASWLISLLFQQLGVALPVDLARRGITPQTYGWIVGLNGVAIVLLQPLAARLVERGARSRWLALGSLLVGAGFAVNGWVASAPAFAGGVLVWTLGEILVAPLGPAVVADLAPDGLRGTYQGSFQASLAVGHLVAPLLGTAALAGLGSRAAWSACLVLGLVIAAIHVAAAPARARRLGRARD